jgi:uncharacterized protein (TIGR02118 family)
VLQSSAPSESLIKVSVFYPNGESNFFDITYYENKHMPMVAEYLGINLKYYEIDKGISGRTSSDQIPFLAVGHFYVKDLSEYNKVITQHREMIVADFKNYTNIQPLILISEVKQKRPLLRVEK